MDLIEKFPNIDDAEGESTPELDSAANEAVAELFGENDRKGYEHYPYHRPLSKYESRVNFAKADETFSRLISATNGKLRDVLRKAQKDLIKRATDAMRVLNPSTAGTFKVDVGDEFYRIFRDFLIDAWRDGKDQGYDELPEAIKRAVRQVKQFDQDAIAYSDELYAREYHQPDNPDHDQSSHGNWASGGEGKPLNSKKGFQGEYPEGELGFDSPEVQAWYARGHEWDANVRKELSFGRMTFEQARQLGYHEHGGQWTLLPDELYHVTVAADTVTSDGLRSRDERGIQVADGLGGGPNDTISITERRDFAEGIYRGMMEAREVALGNVTAQDLWQKALDGAQSKRQFAADIARGYANDDKWNLGDPFPGNMRRLFAGTTYVSASEHKELNARMLISQAEMPKGATPYGEGIEGGDGTRRYVGYERLMTKEEKAEASMDFYRRWTAYRQAAGGPYDPVFWGAPHRLAAIDPSQIRVLKLKPKFGAHGVTEPGMRQAEGEFRLYRGDVVEVVSSDKPNVRLFSRKLYAGFEPRQAIDYLTMKALVIKGLLDNELTEDVRQLLLEHLKGGRTLTETLMDLRELFEPWIGDPETFISPPPFVDVPEIIEPSGQVGINTPPGTKSRDNVLQAYRLENMIRTPMIEAYNQGRLAIGDATDDYVIGYQYSAILDTRTTEICENNDGLTIRVDDPRLRKLTPPVHYQALPAGTMIRAKRWHQKGALIPIEELRVGDFVYTHMQRWRRVTETMRHETWPEEIVLHLAKNKTLTLTDDHPVLTQRGWVCAGDLTIDDSVIAVGAPCARCDEWCAGKYCSRICKHADARKSRLCGHCKSEIPRKGKKKNVKYCNRSCAREGRRKYVGRTCLSCGSALIGKWNKPLSATRRFCSFHCYHVYRGESSIETTVRQWLEGASILFIPQYQIGRYTIDYYLPEYHLAVEVDGWYWHVKNPKSAETQRRREKALLKRGLVIVRIPESAIKSGRFARFINEGMKTHEHIASLFATSQDSEDRTPTMQ